MDERRPVRLMRGIGDDIETVVANAADLARAVGSHLDAMLRLVTDMDWEPDFGFDVEDSARLDRCPASFDPDRIDRSGGKARVLRDHGRRPAASDGTFLVRPESRRLR